MNSIKRVLFLIFGGIVGSAVLAFIYLAIHRVLHIDVYNEVYMLLPIGGIFGGGAIAVGYWLGSKMSGYNSGKEMLPIIVVTAAFAHFLIQFVDYMTLADGNASLYTLISFPSFLHNMAMNWEMSTPNSRTHGSSGGFGYVIVIIQIIGLAFGSLMMNFYLPRAADCDVCSGFLKTELDHSRYSEDVEDVEKVAGKVATSIEESRMQSAVDQFKSFGDLPPDINALYRGRLTICACPKCGRRTASFRVSMKEDGLWVPMHDFHAVNGSHETIAYESN